MSAVLERTLTHEMEIVDYCERYAAQVMHLAREMHAESLSHRHMDLDEEKLRRQFEASRVASDRVYLRLAVRDSEVLGGFFGMIEQPYFSQTRVAKDLAWFISHSRRGSRAAVALLRDFERWAVSRGVRIVMLGQSTGVKVQETQTLFEKFGYVAVGVNCVKGV